MALMGHNIHFEGIIWKIIPNYPFYLFLSGGLIVPLIWSSVYLGLWYSKAFGMFLLIYSISVKGKCKCCMTNPCTQGKNTKILWNTASRLSAHCYTKELFKPVNLTNSLTDKNNPAARKSMQAAGKSKLSLPGL